jgi:pSer/pThr/pTyr-binding forkhead associated (FHA) protein
MLDDVTVSRDHARLRRAPDGLYVIEDRDSLNGTYVNRHRIESHRLTDGDELQIGKFKLTYLDR